LQVPRIDINLPFNAIEKDPNVGALYGDGVDDIAIGNGSDYDGSEDGDDASDESDDDEHPEANNISKKNLEVQAFDGEGLLAREEASKLLVLMCHARSCTGRHSSPQHAEICQSTKFLMLHLRDCTSPECSQAWCSPCKKMIKHLTKCANPTTCSVCNPWLVMIHFKKLVYNGFFFDRLLPNSYLQLQSLNAEKFPRMQQRA
jgi:hypothetical protein